VLSGDREVGRLGVRNGATARVSDNDDEGLYLTPSLTANGVELVVAVGPVGGSGADATAVGRYTLTPGLAVEAGTARTRVQVEWLDTASGPAGQAAGPSCRECCVTRDGWTDLRLRSDHAVRPVLLPRYVRLHSRRSAPERLWRRWQGRARRRAGFSGHDERRTTVILSEPGPHPAGESDTRKRDREVHFWLNEADYRFLLAVAAEEGRTIGGVLRRLVQRHREETKAGGLAPRRGNVDAPAIFRYHSGTRCLDTPKLEAHGRAK
jgi:hypothetical protein